MNPYHLLIVDDDKEIADLAGIYLNNEGYKVMKAANGREALHMLETFPFKLVILDIMMPEMDGLEVCRRIREKGNIPIIMLSAKSEEMDKILGLSTGADDYVTKPFHPMELVARVKSQLRRYLLLNKVDPSVEDENSLHVRGLMVNKRTRQVTMDGQDITLTPTEFMILHLMASNLGKVFSAEEIFEKVWKEQYFESKNTVMVHIRKIREKLKTHANETELIKTVWGVGYKIEK
ncbi:DNA-binding response OmpR family regulator [Evansella vedderi]|uniref:DNA-binding response OmpR family regulator n=1 Tax=Evansella vedderi TaxID=38282 RepID=A0ABU0A0M3_9BACI|nr:response regulator transcription factor [Evansella vedderi]MDQ0257046.1 DNA-binding response OmpR family regulator [Evansella vedderi]